MQRAGQGGLPQHGHAAYGADGDEVVGLRRRVAGRVSALRRICRPEQAWHARRP
jgi:hypothetical protein